MRRATVWAMLLALGMPAVALAQSAPINGPNAGAVHGQNWTMRQDLSSLTATQGVPLTRSQRLRRQAAAAEARRPAAQRQRRR